MIAFYIKSLPIFCSQQPTANISHTKIKLWQWRSYLTQIHQLDLH